MILSLTTDSKFSFLRRDFLFLKKGISKENKNDTEEREQNTLKLGVVGAVRQWAH